MITQSTVDPTVGVTFVKATDLRLGLESCVKVKQPAMVWGLTGGGKSSVVRQLASSLGYDLRDVRLVLLDSVDLRGIPTVDKDGCTKWAIPDFLPRKGKGILFFDEFPQAPPSVQAAALQITLDRKLGEYELPDGWTVIAAGNLMTEGAGGHRMITPLKNRFVHYGLKVDVNDWSKWALGAGIEQVVIAFVRFRPELLHKFDKNSNAFPTPRSWEFVSRLLAVRLPSAVEFATIEGTVGHAAAIEFTAFMKTWRDLPNIDSILLNPETAKVPTEPSVIYATAAAIARLATVKNVGRFIKYLDRLATEYNVMAVKFMEQLHPELATAPDVTAWKIQHSDVLF